MEGLLKVKVMELFTAGEFWHFYLLFLVHTGYTCPFTSSGWLCTNHSDRGGVISVHSGCFDKTPQIKWLINNRNLFLTVPEAEKLKITILVVLVFGETLMASFFYFLKILFIYF